MLKALLFALTLLAHGAGFQIPQQTGGYVSDYAGMLSEADEAKLNARLVRFNQATGVQSVIVTVKTLDGDPIEDAAERLFKTWGIGSKERNDGVLLLVSLEERALRIEVGYGLEGRITDADSGRIINDLMLPLFKQGKFYTAFLVYQARIEDLVRGGGPAAGRYGEPQVIHLKAWQALFALFFIFVFFVLFTWVSWKQRFRIRTITGRGGRTHTWRQPGGFGGFGGGGGFGGFGGFGGGGGSSGGGGASGRW